MNDTHPKMAAMQLELLRQAGPEKRMRLGFNLISTAIRLQRQEIARRHPEFSELEIKIEWAEMHYGKEMADRIRAALQTKILPEKIEP